MKIIGLDFETTGLSATDDRIIEEGACLFDWDSKTPLQLLSEFVHPERPIPEEITKLTGITDAHVDEYGISEREAMIELDMLFARADYAMAFNGFNFDQPFYIATCKRLGIEPSGILWLDASADVKYAPEIKTRNLQHLAAEHLILNPFRHRAVFDVLTMLKIAQGYDLDAIIARAAEPTLYVQAIVSFDEKELAKERGYHWCAPKKIWWRSWKQSDFEVDKFECPFRTQLLNGAPE
jgi:DNA polymerase III alpha subunit (gram-positive type)